MRLRRIHIQTILTIAGFDPSSGAGITADLAVISAHGFFGTSAIAALTVQSTLGVKGNYAVDAVILRETLDCLMYDLPPAGIKIGMQASRENVQVVVAAVRAIRESDAKIQVVLDPVVRSSSGRALLSREGIDLMRQELVPLVDWVTPNLDELGLLADVEVRTASEMEGASEVLRGRYPGLNVVATGGHLESPDDLVVLADGRREWVRGTKVASRATHGTGCAYSTALLCGLVAGSDGMAAAEGAKEFVTEAIRRAEAIGHGTGPMNLLWPLRRGLP